MDKELIEYIEMCVNYHHEWDESFKITDSAMQKEALMFLKAIKFLNDLYKESEEGNPTIEQNAGENRIEGGVLSVSGSVSEKHYRPFKDCDELIEHFTRMNEVELGNTPIYYPQTYKPCIWVKHKRYGTGNLIIAFDNNNESIGGSCVFLQDAWFDMQELFDNFTFLDESPCGISE